MIELAAATNIGRYIIYAISLSLLVFVHEFGHFWVARRCGVAVRELALGFGPALFSWRSAKSGTRYRINVLPLGGYCAMIGEDTNRSEDDNQIVGQALTDIGPWHRLAIVAAGPLVNIVFATLILWGAAVAVGSETGIAPVVGHLVAGDPAERAGLQMGDRILAINGKAMNDGKQIIDRIHSSIGVPLEISYERNAVRHEVRVTPIRLNNDKQSYGVIGYSPVMITQRAGVVAGFISAYNETGLMLQKTFEGLAEMTHGFKDAEKNVVGPIGMARAAVTFEEYGPSMYLQFVALLSLSLGVFNLLPIPFLDGGRALFIFAELLRRRPVDPEKEMLVHLTGLAGLVVLVLVKSYHDVIAALSNQPPF